MRLPSIKRLIMQDYQSQAAWIGGLINILNSFMGEVTTGLDNGLTINDNSLAIIKTILVDGSRPSATFVWPFSTKPVGYQAISCTTSANQPQFNPPVMGVYTSGQVTVTCQGLDTTKSYYVTFYVIGG